MATIEDAATAGERIAMAERKAKAGAVKAVEAVIPPPPALQQLVLPVEVTFVRGRPLVVVLVGAGGTGARLASDVARLLSRGDKLVVVDDDTVEDHNLLRQHFIRADVGRYKAEVVARRAQLAATAGVEVSAKVLRLTDFAPFFQGIGGTARRTAAPAHVLCIGAVDTRACRAAAAAWAVNGHVGETSFIWIDAGNELRGGQVGIIASAPAHVSNPMTGEAWPPKDPAEIEVIFRHYRDRDGYTREQIMTHLTPRVHINTLAEQTPAILKPDPAAEGAVAGCAVRIDGQSLAANVMAYACLINLVSRVVDGLPISQGMTFFSTANTMTGKPFVTVAARGLAKSLSNHLAVSTLPLTAGAAGVQQHAERVQKALKEGA